MLIGLSPASPWQICPSIRSRSGTAGWSSLVAPTPSTRQPFRFWWICPDSALGGRRPDGQARSYGADIRLPGDQPRRSRTGHEEDRSHSEEGQGPAVEVEDSPLFQVVVEGNDPKRVSREAMAFAKAVSEYVVDRQESSGVLEGSAGAQPAWQSAPPVEVQSRDVEIAAILCSADPDRRRHGIRT